MLFNNIKFVLNSIFLMLLIKVILKLVSVIKFDYGIFGLTHDLYSPPRFHVKN